MIEKDHSKARKFSLILLISIVIISFLGIIKLPFIPTKILNWLVGFGITTFLAFLVYRGYKVAKWGLGIFLILASLMGFTVIKIAPTQLVYHVFLAFALLHGVLGIVLLFSPQLRQFMDSQSDDHVEKREHNKETTSEKKESHWAKQLKR